MKVTFVIYSLTRGGAERATVNLANYFCKQGWTVTIATIRDDIPPAYTLVDGVQLFPMGLHTSSNSLVLGIYNNLKRIRVIRSSILKNETDVLVGMSSSANILVALACLATTTSAVGSERSHPDNKPISRSWSMIRQHGYRLLNLLICLTDETNAWLKKNTNATTIVTIPNGVDLPLVASEPVIPFSFHAENKKYLISVGRLIQSKCMDHTIRAFANLSQHHTEWELLILGDGPELENLLILTNDLNISDKVHLVGGVGNLDDWYPKADLFVSSSIHEGFPNSMLEAMAYGLTAVSYDCPTGPRDLIDHEVNGLLVPMNDEKVLEAMLGELMEDNVKRKNFSDRASLCREKFSMHSVGQRWMQVLATAYS